MVSAWPNKQHLTTDDRGVITYTILNHSDDITPSEYKAQITAFKLFFNNLFNQLVWPLSFQYTDKKDDADLKFIFHNSDNDPVLKENDSILAYTIPISISNNFKIVINDDYDWSMDDNERWTQYQKTILAHEITHALGVYSHSEDKQCYMYKSIYYDKQVNYNCPDVEELLVSLYGGRVRSVLRIVATYEILSRINASKKSGIPLLFYKVINERYKLRTGTDIDNKKKTNKPSEKKKRKSFIEVIFSILEKLLKSIFSIFNRK